MTQIIHLQISDFRNLRIATLQPSPHFNIFYGQNGAGKTSILEAIYYLSFGRSFRTSNSSRLIHKDSQQFSLFSQLQSANNIIPIGIERNALTGRRIHLNGDNIRTIAPVAELLPIQLISTDSYRFFHDGPKIRRQFMNWGLFHVEPRFFPLWQQLLLLLKQRNAALKARASIAELSVWNDELIDLSEQINQIRKEYIVLLQPVLENLIRTVLNKFSLKIDYSPGWSSTNTYAEALKQSYFKDQALGYTSVGPHRADMQLLLEGQPAGEILSQGQQKLASYALYLAQGQLVRTLSNKSPLYLIDDLPSELDQEKRFCIASILKELNAQVFITGITPEELRDVIAFDKAQLFHVKQNTVQKE